MLRACPSLYRHWARRIFVSLFFGLSLCFTSQKQFEVIRCQRPSLRASFLEIDELKRPDGLNIGKCEISHFLKPRITSAHFKNLSVAQHLAFSQLSEQFCLLDKFSFFIDLSCRNLGLRWVRTHPYRYRLPSFNSYLCESPFQQMSIGSEHYKFCLVFLISE